MKLLVREKIFTPGEYFPQCHASTVAVLPGGTVAAAWFAGEAEGREDVAVWGALRTAAGWSRPRVWADIPGEPCWNPVLRPRGGRRLTLYFKAGHTIPRWRTYVCESEDGGASFSLPRELVPGDEGGRGPVKNKGLEMDDGTYLAPMSVETAAAWDAGVDITTDGRTWRTAWVPLEHGGLQGLGVIQPTLWQGREGEIRMLLRSTEGVIYASRSADGGWTWDPARPTALPNNNSGLDAVGLPGGRVVLACNPVSGKWAARSPLTLLASEDGGESFAPALELENRPGGEFSYPAVVEADGVLHMTYTYDRQTIVYCQVEP